MKFRGSAVASYAYSEADAHLETGTSSGYVLHVPERAGYSFAGYYDAASGGNRVYDAAGKAVQGTYWTASGSQGAFKGLPDADATVMTLHARWTANKYTVTLDRQGGSGGTAGVTATYGSALPAITPPTRGKYVFGGYYAAANGGGARYYTASGASARSWDRTGTTTLYAKWTANTYKIEIDFGAAVTFRGNAVASYTYPETDAHLETGTSSGYVLHVPTRAEYAFDGYYDAASGGNCVYDAAGKAVQGTYWTASGSKGTFKGLPDANATVMTLYARWRDPSQTYTVTLDRQGGSGGPASVTATYGSPMPAITPPTRAKYAFGGYYTAADGGGTQYYTASGTSARNWDKTSEITLYARWMTNMYTVTFNANGGVFSLPGSTNTTMKVPVPKGKAIGTLDESVLPDPTRAGYAFNGWYTKKSAGTKITKKTKVTKNVTWYARWTVKKYKIAVKKVGKGTVSGAGSKAYKSKVTLKAKAASGYVFQGWYLDDVLKSTKASYSVKVPLNGATYTAKFITKAEDKAGIAVEFEGVGVGGAFGASTLPAVTNVCGVLTTWPVAATGLTPVSVSVTGLPKGMKYDAKKMVITGVATVAKSGTMKITVKSTGASRTWSVKWRTVALPTWAVGTFKGNLYDGEGGASKGTVTLTVGKTGKVSGKFVDTKKTAYSFAVASFKSFDGGVLRTQASMKYGTKTVTVKIAVGLDDKTSIGFAEVGSTAAPFSGVAARLAK